MKKNWKSFIAFLVFGYAFIDSVNKENQNHDVILTTGILFLIVTIAMMLRAEQNYELVKTLIGRMKNA